MADRMKQSGDSGARPDSTDIAKGDPLEGLISGAGVGSITGAGLGAINNPDEDLKITGNEPPPTGEGLAAVPNSDLAGRGTDAGPDKGDVDPGHATGGMDRGMGTDPGVSLGDTDTDFEGMNPATALGRGGTDSDLPGGTGTAGEGILTGPNRTNYGDDTDLGGSDTNTAAAPPIR